MKSKLIKSTVGQAELTGHQGVLVLESSRESVTIRGQVNGEVELQLSLNERELFHGNAADLEASMEAVRALRGLRGNFSVINNLRQLVDSADATALLHFLAE